MRLLPFSYTLCMANGESADAVLLRRKGISEHSLSLSLFPLLFFPSSSPLLFGLEKAFDEFIYVLNT